MSQSQLTQFFGAVRGGRGAAAVCSPRNNTAASDDVARSDDDAPMVSSRHIKSAHAGFARSDGRVLVTAKRSRYEGEASECSDVEDGSSASDSFVVSDHFSDVDGSSPEAQESLRTICQCLRNRKQFLHCPQCLRLVRVILRFLSDVVENMPDY